ncbi:MAG: hypothetical protein QOD06_1972 [Candidatus Binatota bacterium]|nr:hypothetical protein [Candidatus Binatota bacterium]
MRTLRGAIAGFGRVAAEAHVPGFRAAGGFEVVAVVDPSPEQRELAARVLPGVPTFADLAALAAAPVKVDFVDVAAPPALHAPLGLEALGRRWHVLCEKPLAVSVDDVGKLAAAARRSSRVIFTVHNWKHAPILRRLHGLIGAGTVGDLAEIDWEILRPSPPDGAVADARTWRLDRAAAGGGVVMDHGWHAFYALLFLSGRQPVAVTADLRRERGLDVEDNAEVTLELGDCVARIHLSWTAGERRSRVRARGPVGEIVVDEDVLVVRVAGRADDETRFAPPLSASSVHPEWFPPVAEEFREEVMHVDRRGRNLAVARKCAELVAAAYASEGRRIVLAGDPLA